jgi:hypothetical protein
MASFETDLPVFKTILPFSKREVEFRPFRVKEEKVLLMANAGDSIKDVTTAVENIVSACTNGAVTATNSSMFDVQHMWLQLRGKSISEDLEFTLTCGVCEHQTNMTIHIDDFKFRETAGHSAVIDLGGCSVEMRYPTFEDYANLYEIDSAEMVYDVVAACITKIVTQEEVRLNTPDTKAEFREFVDNIIPIQFKKLEKFFTTMPVLEYIAKYTCAGCDTEKEVAIDGVQNFFGS